MFRLTLEESNRSQSVTGSQKHRDPRYPPRAFTQEGGDLRRRTGGGLLMAALFELLKRLFAITKLAAIRLSEADGDPRAQLRSE